MEANKLMFLGEAGKLKRLERTGWVLKDIHKPETVSGHMYRMSLIPLLVLDKFGDLNKDKIIKLCLIHDLAECIVGDITPHDNVSKEEKHRRETDAVNYLATLLPNSQAEELKKLFNEYEDQKTPESQLTKDLDRFDMVYQAFEYEKLEFDRTGAIPDLSEFFNHGKVLSTIKNQEIKDLISEIILQRDNFWSKNSSNKPIVNGDQLKSFNSTENNCKQVVGDCISKSD